MAACTVTRVVKFSASHHYAVAGWSEEQNRSAFGRIAEPHRHDYECAVTVRGTPDPGTGLIVDLARFDGVLKEAIVDRYDGRDLNADAAFAGGRPLPSSEALAMDIWRRIAPRLAPGCALVTVRVQENPTLYAEYHGD